MSKLKTLKDFEDGENINIEYDMQPNEATDALIDELKQEAIKWFKDAENRSKKSKDYSTSESAMIGVMEFIRNFFNLTAEDVE